MAVIASCQKLVHIYLKSVAVIKNYLKFWIMQWHLQKQFTFQLYSRCHNYERSMQWRTTVGTVPLHDWSALRRDFYLTTQNTNMIKTSMPSCNSNPHSNIVDIDHSVTVNFYHTLKCNQNALTSKASEYTMNSLLLQRSNRALAFELRVDGI